MYTNKFEIINKIKLFQSLNVKECVLKINHYVKLREQEAYLIDGVFGSTASKSTVCIFRIKAKVS